MDLQDRHLSCSLYNKCRSLLYGTENPLRGILEIIYNMPATGKGIKNVTINRQGKMTFLPKGKESVLNYDETHDMFTWKRDNRQEGSFGRVLRKLITENGFKAGKDEDCHFTDSHLEALVNMLKGQFTVEGTFKVVSGRSIPHYYHYSRYDGHFNLGSLESSCMRHSGPCEDACEYYANNPKTCEMVILLNEEIDRIRGRALLWTDSYTNTKFMDRIYANDHVIEAFKEYAHKNGWAHKQSQSYSGCKWVFPDGDVRNQYVKVNMPGYYEVYPYMDTMFGIMDGNGGYCTNDDGLSRVFYAQEEPGNQVDNDDYTWDDINGTEIHQEYAVWLDYRSETTHVDNCFECAMSGDWIYEEDGVTLANGDRVWRDDDEIIYLSSEDEWYLMSDVGYCDYSEQDYVVDDIVYLDKLCMHVHVDHVQEAYEDAGWELNREGVWINPEVLNF